MPADRRRYTKSEKATAVGLAMAKGTTQAAEQLGIPETTVGYWVRHPEFAELRAKTRDAVADEMWATIQIGIREVAKGITGDAPLRDKATALGILYDKHALLTGAATSRSEARDITGTVSDAELIAAVREVERITDPGRAPVPAEDAPAG